MARGRSPKYEDQRETILTGATQLFARNGFSSTSMNQVAEICGLSKASLYHYFRDKYALLVHITESHLTMLESVIEEVLAQRLEPKEHLHLLIQRFVENYAGAQDAHRVLTESVRYFNPEDLERIRHRERELVEVFTEAITNLRQEMRSSLLAKPIAMLLFGMMNWMFTWLKEDGALTYEEMAPIVADLFFGGFAAVQLAEIKK